VVITFDPNGSNLHPDHVAISRFMSDAIAAARDPRWFPEAGRAHEVTRLLWPPRRPWEILRAGAVPSRAGVDFVIDISPFAALKAEALRAHRTQHLSMDRIFFARPDTNLVLSAELFRQAWGPPAPSTPSDDLFAGI
jgi:LmbE family N-acetylglucosaminyl deacetylase